jgi:hypothetical protein
MSFNLLVWRWSAEYSDRNRQRREQLTHQKVASEFMESGSHYALEGFDQDSFLTEIESSFPGDETDKPFVIERYETAIVFNYGAGDRLRVAPIIGRIAMKAGLNATEA